MKKAVAVFCGSSKPENNSLIEKEVNKLASYTPLDNSFGSLWVLYKISRCLVEANPM